MDVTYTFCAMPALLVIIIVIRCYYCQIDGIITDFEGKSNSSLSNRNKQARNTSYTGHFKFSSSHTHDHTQKKKQTNCNILFNIV